MGRQLGLIELDVIVILIVSKDALRDRKIILETGKIYFSSLIPAQRSPWAAVAAKKFRHKK